MKNLNTLPIMLVATLLLTACGGSSGDSSESIPNTPSTTTISAGRLLAAQCAQCHGTDGVSITEIDSLAGESRDKIIEELLEMQNETDNEVMHLQAKQQFPLPPSNIE